ncbi:hypothetical protein FAUST_8529 [Fusarium austroamericanum]|uniref:Uncharacterized protein n=1 Tax=Fusarium austroamericanum TaxID=282268 RepID=A0AAN5Z5V7_FUSAU|nr:hypothetical protein FAUST_8529 [Fusarium austroamericanum]
MQVNSGTTDARSNPEPATGVNQVIKYESKGISDMKNPPPGAEHDGIWGEGAGSMSPPPPKRKRTLPPSLKGNNIPDQPPSTTIQRRWPLLGHPESSTSTAAIDKLEAIVDHLEGQATFKKGDEDYKIQTKLRCKVGSELRKWAVIGCQLCYVHNNTSLDHDLESCTAAGSGVAHRILSWLKTVHLERHAAKVNQCSLCTETDQICEDIDPDRFCENKPAARRTIAALCAVDDQVLGKALTSFVFKTYNADLALESQAAKWFAAKVPLEETWVPQLLVAFDLLVRGFEFLSRDTVGRDGDDDDDDHGAHDTRPSGFRKASTHQPPTIDLMSWDNDEEVREWKLVMDWWVGKCSFCAG